jgi:hypothetical protein
MLLVLLLISSGCVVNIPGCGKRTLPFFKKVSEFSTVYSPMVNSLPLTTSTTMGSKSPSPQSIVSIHPQDQGSMEIPLVSSGTSKLSFTPTATATPQDVEQFAYTLLENQKPTLWCMNTDGTNSARLTSLGTSSFYPSWSPSGKFLAFLSDQIDGKLNLFVLEKGAKTPQQLTFYDDMTIPDSLSLKPPFTWSPKSDEIAYIYHGQVWKVSTETQTTVSLYTPAYTSYSITDIQWAPYRDNRPIAFLLKKGEQSFSLWLVNPRLLDKLKLVDVNYSTQDISWSSDAQEVAYLYNSNYIFTASPETSIPQPLILNASPELGPIIRYSPSETGSSPLLVLAKKDPSEDNYRVALVDQPSKDQTDTGKLNYLTEPGVTNAIWSPDGDKIAYIQSGDLWTMDVSGLNKTKISIAGVQFPDWSKK